MKKAAGIVLGVVVLLVLVVAPAGVGLMAEKHYRQLWQAALADQSGYSATLSEYERGWFNSSARVVITITDPSMVQLLGELDWIETDTVNGEVRLNVHERIHHGPLALGAPAPLSQRLRPGAGIVHTRLNQTLSLAEADLNRLEMTTHLGLGGRLHARLRAGPTAFEFGDGSSIRLDHRITADIHTDRTFQRLYSRLRGESLHIRGAEGETISLESIRVNTEQHRSDTGLWLGDTDFRTGLIKLAFPTGAPLEVRDLQWHSHASEVDALMEQQHTIHAASLHTGAIRAAPVQLELTLFNLDTGAIIALQEQLAELPPPHPDAPADAYATEVLDKVRDNLRQMARREPGVRIDTLSVGFDGGSLDGSGRLALTVTDDAQFDRYLDQGRLIHLFRGEGHLTTGRALVRQSLMRSMSNGASQPEVEQELARMADSQIDEAIATGLVVENADQLEMRLKLEQGIFYLNQREIYRF